jgi:hypothetical protein
MNINMHMDPYLVAGVTFNVNVREDLIKTLEEVECLKRQNKHFLEDIKRLNEVNRDAPEATKRIYDFVVGKHVGELTVLWSHMKVNESHLDTELKKAEVENNNIRQMLDYVSRDLNAEGRIHNTLKNTHSRWELLNYSRSRNPSCARAHMHREIQAPREPLN